jgi:DNA-binding phage protein
MHLIFNVAMLVADAGGASKIARDTFYSKTRIQRWLRTGCMTTDELATVLQHNPNLSLDDYVGLSGSFSQEVMYGLE